MYIYSIIYRHLFWHVLLGSTSILHDNEAPMNVGHCADPGCYSQPIVYNATMKQMNALAELSKECHQSIQVKVFERLFVFFQRAVTAINYLSVIFFRWIINISIYFDCSYAPFQFDGLTYACWNDKNGISQTFWAGSNASILHTCQCGIDHNCAQAYNV